MTSIAIVGLATISFGQTLPSYIPSNGLVGWWPFNGNASDESGNGNDGTVYGSTLTSDRNGNINSAYSFDGSNKINLGRLSIIDTLNATKDIAYSLWFKADQNQSQFDKMPLLSKRQEPWQSADYNQSYFTIHAGGQAFYPRNNKFICYAFVDAHMYSYGINNGMDGGQTDDNNWHQIVATKDNNHYSMYFDGLLIDTITDNSILYSIDSMIVGYQGLWGFNTERWYKGIVDDIGIWNRALTQEEITSLYSGSSADIKELSQSNLFSVFPNPAQSVINVNIEANLVGSVFTIYDNTGKAVKTGKLNSSNTTIDVNDLSGGIYSFSVGGNSKQTFKVIKE